MSKGSVANRWLGYNSYNRTNALYYLLESFDSFVLGLASDISKVPNRLDEIVDDVFREIVEADWILGTHEFGCCWRREKMETVFRKHLATKDEMADFF